MKNVFDNGVDLILWSFMLITMVLMFNVYTHNIVQEAPKEVEKVAKLVDKKQLQCLAQNIYYEAGSESTEGKAAVARVVMNRVRQGFGPNPCKVVFQTYNITKVNEDTLETEKVKLCQFSWVCEGKGLPNERDKRYQASKQVAYDVLAYDAYKDIIPKSVLFFHAVSTSPQWAYHKVKKIGNHIFYRK